MSINGSMYNIVKKIYNFCGVGIFLTTLFIVSIVQWLCVRFMATYCHVGGLWGIISNPIYMGSPICLGVNNVQIALVNHYVGIIAAGSLGFIGFITSRMKI
jgi:hypothetical protein